MLARHGNTRRVDHIGFDALSPQPPRQPKAVPAGFVGHGDPIDPRLREDAARPGCFVAPAIQQLQQGRLVRRKFLQRLAVDPGTMPATSQLDWLISMTATSVLS
jgi:hypothetical protein